MIVMIPPNGATAEGTRAFQKKQASSIHADKFKALQDWQASGIGLGTYLGNYDDATDALYEEAIENALGLGVNVIDTAINYRCQRSERTIGGCLKKLFQSKKIHRSQVIVATKGGFVPFDGSPPSNMESYIHDNWIKTGIVKEEDIVSSCHCLAPAYIQNQINQSLKNLMLDTIDIYYLHNPETQLAKVDEDQFYERLKGAFECLEENVQKGKIQYYGLATWNAFRESVGRAESISLEKVVQCAEKAGGTSHHFKVIQFPYNMAMLEAMALAGQTLQGKQYPILSVAYHFGISAMISAPLLQKQLLDLPSTLLKRIPGSLSPAQKALQFVLSTPGVASALVGMKSKKHVEENLGVLGESNWDSQTLQQVCDLLVSR